MDWIANPEIWTGLLTLTLLEIVLGIDNIIFISILAGKLPKEQQAKARRLGLLGALVTRLLLLGTITWVVRLTMPLFSLFGHDFSGQGLILLAGGIFLIGKSVHEIHDRLEGPTEHAAAGPVAGMAAVVIQITLLDIVFSLDSVITAVGLVKQLPVMVAAVVLAMLVMLASAGSISDFVSRHPTIKMLALSFLLLIGVMLIAEGWGHHIPKGYIYFAMAFAVFVELLNLRVRSTAEPVHLHQRLPE